ncbi:MAG TPA: transposase [Planctomycetota bacterium]|nr:transposase [Planctomycetota bacterium]
MNYNPRIHHRRSIRLRGYDYSHAGMYFVTFVTGKRKYLFGRTAGSALELNAAGSMVSDAWISVSSRFHGVIIDCFVIMPNHAHGVIVLTRGPVGFAMAPVGYNDADNDGEEGKRTALGDVVYHLKSFTIDRYREGVKDLQWERYAGRVWQKNYYERIIRDSEELVRIRNYVKQNPENWILDRENPERVGDDPFDVWLDSVGGMQIATSKT